MSATNYFKVLSSLAHRAALVFPFDGTRRDSTMAAWTQAEEARNSLGASGIAYWKRPEFAGPWDHAKEVGR